MVLYGHYTLVCASMHGCIHHINMRPTQVKIQVSKEALGGIPIWVIIISILIGLLILALVIFALWKVISLSFKYHVTLRGRLSPARFSSIFFPLIGKILFPIRCCYANMSCWFRCRWLPIHYGKRGRAEIT